MLRKQYCSAALLCSNPSTYICDSAGIEPRTAIKSVTVCRRLGQEGDLKTATVADTFWTPYEHFMKRLSGLINGHNILASRAAPKCIHSMLMNILMVRKYETRFKILKQLIWKQDLVRYNEAVKKNTKILLGNF